MITTFELVCKYDPVLHCVVTLTEELALEQAKRADDEIARGRYRGILHGIPWGVKDLFAVRGYRTTWGAGQFQERLIDTDATVVTRLREAGAVLAAKLATGAFASGEVWFGGKTRNPWNTDEGSSGSSAGPGAATSAGLVGFSVGTETRGSIAGPCERCGATGLRPTFGRVSRYGVMTLSWSMDKPGPICRTAEDCAVVFNAVYGPDGLDNTVVDAPFDWNPSFKVSGLRVGYVEAEFDGTVESVGDRAKLNRRFNLVPAVEYIQANRIRTRLMQAMAGTLSKVDVYVTPSFVGPTNWLTNITGNPELIIPHGFNDSGSPVSISFVGKPFGEATMLALACAFQRVTDYHLKHPPF